MRLRKRDNLDQTHGLETTFSTLNCDLYTTPDCIRAQYDFYYTPKATAKNSYGIGKLFNQVVFVIPT